jgi:hypothetical protein
LLSSFLFALYQMNVFQFAPHFVLGSVLALLVVRGGSVLPAILFHLVWNLFAVVPAFYPEVFQAFPGFGEGEEVSEGMRWAVILSCLALAAAILAGMLHRGRGAKATEPADSTTVCRSGRHPLLTGNFPNDRTPQAPS